MTIATSDGAPYRTSEKAGVVLDGVTTRVRLNREGEGPVTFECSLSLPETLSNEARIAIARAVANCPVRRTLARGIEFVVSEASGLTTAPA